jgi:hypothetical protein
MHQSLVSLHCPSSSHSMLTKLMKQTALLVGGIGFFFMQPALRLRAQDPVKSFPKNYSIALDNPSVVVVRVHYGPHEQIRVHDHSKLPTVYVYLSDSGPVQFSHEEDPPFALTRPAIKKGAFRVSQGRVERHGVHNMDSISSDFLRVELKQIPLGVLGASFRGAAPSDFLRSRTAKEFDNPLLEIDRVICAASEVCKISPSISASVLVSFGPAHLTNESARQESTRIPEGDVRWLGAGERLEVSGDGIQPAHFLRFLLKESAAQNGM